MGAPKRFKTMVAVTRGGWSEWVYPRPNAGYFFKCCDCGLVHEMQFATFAETHQKRGTFQVHRLPWPIRVMFRARRMKP